MPKISVLLPVKNGEKYIAESIDSVLAQTHTDFELLVYDDLSTDSTIDIIRSYQDSRIKLFIGKDGFIANLNSGIERAKGLYIARIDADDRMQNGRLETQLDIMESLGVDVCCSWVNVFGSRYNSGIVNYGKSGLIKNALEELAKTNFVAHPSVMLRKEFLIRHHLRYMNYTHAEDYKLWSEVAKKGGIFYMVPEILTDYRRSHDQISRKHADIVKNQSLRIENEIKEFLKGR